MGSRLFTATLHAGRPCAGRELTPCIGDRLVALCRARGALRYEIARIPRRALTTRSGGELARTMVIQRPYFWRPPSVLIWIRIETLLRSQDEYRTGAMGGYDER